MYKSLYYLYFFKFKSKKFDILYSRIIVRIFNHVLPYYFKLTKNNSKHKLSKQPKSVNEEYIVSLTTFPKRIEKVWLTIETILRQDVKPDKVILNLYEGEFEGKTSLPKMLLDQESRGLQIYFTKENLMPHLKYFYTLKEYPEANIITVDDDIIYPANIVEKLIKAHHQYPRAICSIISREVGVVDSQIYPYHKWEYVKDDSIPKFKNLVMGFGGTLYPKNSLHADIFDIKKIKSLTLRADDLWLKVMSIKNKTKVASLSGSYSRMFVPTIIENNINLMDSNIVGGDNDKIFQELIDYYKIPISIFK